MASFTPSQTRLHVLLARASRRTLVFRRGPAKAVLRMNGDEMPLIWRRRTPRSSRSR